MENKQEKIFNKVVGITENNTLIMIRSVFNYTDGMHGSPFFGAQYAEFSPIDQNYIDERNDTDRLKEDYDYLWKESVANGDTELGLTEYMEELKEIEESNSDGEFIGHDTSYIFDIPDEYKEKMNCISFECIGCGRMSRRQTYKEIFDLDLILIAESFEFGSVPDFSVFDSHLSLV